MATPLRAGLVRADDLTARLAPWCAALALLFCIPLAEMLVASQFLHTNTLRVDGFSLARGIAGTAARPYAFRVMTPWLVRLILACHAQGLPIPFLNPVVIASCPRIEAATTTSCDQVRAYAVLAFLCAWGFLAGTYWAALRVVGGAVWGLAAIVLAALGVNAILLQGYGHLYDFPVLCAATSLFIMALIQRDGAFLFAFAVSCLVKESLFLFVVVYVLIGLAQRPVRDAARNLILQCTVFVIVYGWERVHFGGNIGLPIYSYWRDQIGFLMDRTSIVDLAVLMLFGAALLYRLPRKHPALRRAMLILPVMLCLYFAGGTPGEFRVAFDVFPILLLPMVDSLRRLAQPA